MDFLSQSIVNRIMNMFTCTSSSASASHFQLSNNLEEIGKIYDIQQDQFNQQITRDDPPYVWYTSYAIWGAFTIYTIVTLITFFFRRNKQPVKARSSLFVFILIIAHYFSFTILSLRLAVKREAFPCIFYLSFQFYGFPLIAIPYLVLCIRLYYISEMNRLQGDSFKSHLVSMGVDLLETSSTTEKKLDKSSSQIHLLTANSSLSQITTDASPATVSTTGSFDLALDRKNSQNIPHLKRDSSTSKSFKERVKSALHLGGNVDNTAKSKKWSEKRQKRLKQLRKLAREDFTAKIFLFTFLLNSIIFLAYCGVFLNRLTGQETWNVGCAATIPVYAGSISLILFYGIFILFFFYKVMRYAKESFGIKAELVSVVVIWAIFLIGFILMSVIPQYQAEPEYYFAAAWMVNIPLFITSIISVWIPLIRSFLWQNSDGKKIGIKNKNNSADRSGSSNLFRDLSSDMENDRIRKILYTEAGFLTKENAEEQDERIVDTRVILFVMFNEEVCQKYFKEWCELEFSAENFLFLYFSNKVFNNLPTHTFEDIRKKTQILHKLNESFIVNGAPFELNLSSNVKKEFDRSLKQLNQLVETHLNKSGDQEMTEKGDSSWQSSNTDLLNTILDNVEITCLNCVQDTWSRFILSSNFIDMVRELKKYDDDMKNLNLV
ncbi:predicted protein [Naegleria gruberi]|uniref:Predicted protein n=1 Tax=Naegleria gruberi TaxID=5762 RepID=D2V8T0_NAEGR|nr:uncharacterized protein NAEGRDRAFT_65267 [Naegleria gruberi]EFC46856.1 predicted protein [Naegleria gruberi]|eukprot:XP_002679600.1 predicted protein [Naegleria gruberi strain NEG-M]